MSTTIALEQIRIASPCTARWEDMMPVGDGAKARHCGQCGLDVHDLSAMTREEAEAFVGGTASGGRLCVRLYRRADGRVITQDCPVGLHAARAAIRRIAGRGVAALAVVFAGAFLAGATHGDGALRMSRLRPFTTIRQWLSPPNYLNTRMQQVTMGRACIRPMPRERRRRFRNCQVIAFAGGFAAVFMTLITWTLWANPYFTRTGLLFDALDSPGERLTVLGAVLLAAPLAGAWIGMEVVTRLRPVRAMDHRVRRGGRLAVAGMAAGVLSAAGSAMLLSFSEAWVPDAVVTGGLSMVFAALVLVPFARRRVGHCIHCGYDLRGGALRATCPECGAVGSAA